MKPKSYEYFSNNAESMYLFKSVVSFATAWVTDKELFNKIDTLAKVKRAENPNSFLYFSHFPSPIFFYSYYSDYEKQNGKLIGSLVEAAFDLMEDKFILFKNGTAMPVGGVTSKMGQSFGLNEDWIKYLHDNDLLYNHLFGFRYVIEKYQQSVVKIEVLSSEGDYSIGTGWLLDIIRPDTQRIRFVLTNDHVIAECKSFKVLTKDEILIPHYEIERFQEREGIDMAIIRVDKDPQVPDFNLTSPQGILDEIITIGYPSIPNSREAYQVVHKGEINSYVKDYSNQDLLIISARTSPGHSGSPVLDEMGRVVGMVARELFEKDAFIQKGITPYFACLPATIIYEMINKSGLIKRLITDT